MRTLKRLLGLLFMLSPFVLAFTVAARELGPGRAALVLLSALALAGMVALGVELYYS